MVENAASIGFEIPAPGAGHGHLNVTPDSFRTGRFLETDAAVEQGLRMEAEGRNLSMWAEVPRPGATP